jgi:hypothetical protein
MIIDTPDIDIIRLLLVVFRQGPDPAGCKEFRLIEQPRQQKDQSFLRHQRQQDLLAVTVLFVRPVPVVLQPVVLEPVIRFLKSASLCRVFFSMIETAKRVVNPTMDWMRSWTGDPAMDNVS